MREDWSHTSKDQLARLFPIVLEHHDPKWKEYYLQERDFLQSVFDKHAIRISHIGSSSVAGLLAKPTVDVLLEISDDTDVEAITEKLLDEGYVVNAAKNDIITYIKGYTPRGFEGQTVHIHVRHYGDWGELYFRDYLILYPKVAREYEILKMGLKDKYMNNRDEYTEAKGRFISKYTEKARMEFPNRYAP